MENALPSSWLVNSFERIGLAVAVSGFVVGDFHKGQQKWSEDLFCYRIIVTRHNYYENCIEVKRYSSGLKGFCSCFTFHLRYNIK
jgi:hypothetical protein